MSYSHVPFNNQSKCWKIHLSKENNIYKANGDVLLMKKMKTYAYNIFMVQSIYLHCKETIHDKTKK